MNVYLIDFDHTLILDESDHPTEGSGVGFGVQNLSMLFRMVGDSISQRNSTAIPMRAHKDGRDVEKRPRSLSQPIG